MKQHIEEHRGDARRPDLKCYNYEYYLLGVYHAPELLESCGQEKVHCKVHNRVGLGARRQQIFGLNQRGSHFVALHLRWDLPLNLCALLEDFPLGSFKVLDVIELDLQQIGAICTDLYRVFKFQIARQCPFRHVCDIVGIAQ